MKEEDKDMKPESIIYFSCDIRSQKDESGRRWSQKRNQGLIMKRFVNHKDLDFI